MPLYEYYCRRCEQRFELLRPLARMDDPAPCPKGHDGGERVLSTFAAFSGSASGESGSLGGGGCAGCSAGSCAGCGVN